MRSIFYKNCWCQLLYSLHPITFYFLMCYSWMSTSILRICFPTNSVYQHFLKLAYYLPILGLIFFKNARLPHFLFFRVIFLHFYYIMSVAKDLLILLEYYNVLQVLPICIVCLPIIFLVLLRFVTISDF